MKLFLIEILSVAFASSALAAIPKRLPAQKPANRAMTDFFTMTPEKTLFARHAARRWYSRPREHSPHALVCQRKKRKDSLR